MAQVPYPDGRVFFTGANASIPAGFTRDTQFDTRYLSGADTSYTGPTESDGTFADAPTSTNHTHEDTGHTHTITSNSGGPGVGAAKAGGSNVMLPPQTHTHDFAEPTPSSTYGYGAGTVVLLDSVQLGPWGRKLIVIKPDDANQEVPPGCIVFGISATAPSGYAIADGTGGTMDLISPSAFVLGADAGGDGGGALGSTVHNHVRTGTHTHTATAHDHGTATSGMSDPVLPNTGSGATDSTVWGHHDIPTNSTTMPTTGTETAGNAGNNVLTHDPLNTSAVPYQNTSGTQQPILPDMIIAWVGTYANIPSDWFLCDESEHVGCPNLKNRYLRGKTTSGTEAGAVDHVHRILNHQHTIGGTHTHTLGTVTWNAANTPAAGFGFPQVALAQVTHTHSAWTISTHTNPANTSGTVENNVTSAVGNEPKNITVLWIIFKPVTVAILGRTTVKGTTLIAGIVP